MIFRAVRRFGWSLTIARAGWWRWLIAALVASLVSVSAAAAAAPVDRAPAVGGPLARPAAYSPQLGQRLAIFVLQQLSKSQLPGSVAIGRLLEQFGLGDKPESDIAGVRSDLGEIQTRLGTLETAVAQLRAEVAQSEYSVLVGQASPITSAIDRGMADLEELANIPVNDPAKKGFTDATLRFINRNLIEKPAQEELTKLITGEAGSDGLIKAFSKAEAARTRYWTPRTSQQVLEVFDYYQAEESRLLLLRVEFWHTDPLTWPAPYIERQIRKVEQEVGTPEKTTTPAAVGTQEALLKRDICCGVFAETGTPLDWGYIDLGRSYTWREAQAQVATYSARGWRLPTVSELQALIAPAPAFAGYPGFVAPLYQTWGQWLDSRLGGLLPTQFASAVWAESPRCSATYDSCSYFLYDGKVGKTEIDYGLNNNLLLVRNRTESWWW